MHEFMSFYLLHYCFCFGGWMLDKRLIIPDAGFMDCVRQPLFAWRLSEVCTILPNMLHGTRVCLCILIFYHTFAGICVVSMHYRDIITTKSYLQSWLQTCPGD